MTAFIDIYSRFQVKLHTCFGFINGLLLFNEQLLPNADEFPHIEQFLGYIADINALILLPNQSLATEMLLRNDQHVVFFLSDSWLCNQLVYDCVLCLKSFFQNFNVNTAPYFYCFDAFVLIPPLFELIFLN